MDRGRTVLVAWESDDPKLRYFVGDAKNKETVAGFLTKSYDAIVDFMTYLTIALRIGTNCCFPLQGITSTFLSTVYTPMRSIPFARPRPVC